jgi:hypothetical protein
MKYKGRKSNGKIEILKKLHNYRRPGPPQISNGFFFFKVQNYRRPHPSLNGSSVSKTCNFAGSRICGGLARR